MSCPPDWRNTLRRASYGAARFEVETEKEGGGRRLKIHEFPHVDDPYIEDLGESRRDFPITAYVHGQDAGTQSDIMVAALSAEGAQRLVLPMFYAGQARCHKWTRTREKDKMGLIAFDISFVRDKGLSPLSLVTGELGRLAEVALGNLQGPLVGGFASVFKGVGVPAFVTASSAGLIGGLAGKLESLRGGFSLSSLASAGLRSGIGDLLADAGKLAATGAVGDLLTPASYIRRSLNVPHELPGRVFGLLDGFAGGAAPADAVRLFGDLAGFESPLVPSLKTASRRIEAANHDAIGKLVRRYALGHMAVATTKVDYTGRRGAIQARADIAELFDMEMRRG